MLNEDCYRLLNISPESGEKAIKKAYRDRSKELHPDVNPSPDAAAQFAKLSAAAETLLDPIQRLKHDDRFGYNKTLRNQDANAKQKFSEQQTEKAASTVSQWKSDYGKAMRMREQQRGQVIARHRKNMLFIVIAVVVFVLAVVTTLMVFMAQ